MASTDPADWHLSYLQSVLDCTGDPLFVTERDPRDHAGYRIRLVNEAFVRLTGYTEAEATGMPPTFLCAACNPPQLLDQVRTAFDHGDHACFRLLNMRKDGSRYRTELMIRPILDDGVCTHVVAVQQVNATAGRAEPETGVAERQFQILANNLDEAVLIYRDKQPLFANEAYVELFGYTSTAEALREISPLMNLPLTDSATAGAAIEGRIAPSRRQPVRCEALHTDGHPLYLLIHGHRIEWRGNPATMLTITEDRRRPVPLGAATRGEPRDVGGPIAAPDEAALLSELMDSIPVMLAHKSRDLRYLYVNKPYADWVGLPREHIVGHHVGEVRNEAHYQMMKSRRAEVLSGRTVRYNTKCEFPGRGMCDLQTTLIPQHDASGAVAGYFSLTQDITDLKEVERTLLQREQQLRLVMDSVPALITYRDRNLRYQYVNRRYHEWFGARREDMIGRHMADFMDLELFRRLKPYLDRVLAGEQVSHSQVVNFPGVGWRKQRISFIPHVDESGHVVGFFSLGQELAMAGDETPRDDGSDAAAPVTRAALRVTGK